MSKIKPFVLEPCLVERVWGVDSIPRWYAQPKPGHPVGEVWLTAEDCKVVDGQGTLADEAEQFPQALGNENENGFPLLLKMLYPQDWLSVQVHPNDAQARAFGEPRGKTECWYILTAEPGATVALGFLGEPTSLEITEAIAAGALESKLRYLPVSAGDLVFVEANTVHAIGPGVIVFEVQQYSDVTYRLYDYGRPRELHLKDGLAVIRHDTQVGILEPKLCDGYTRLVECKYFAVDRFVCDANGDARLGPGEKLQIVVPLQEGCVLQYGHGERLPLQSGAAAVLPAGLGDVRVHCAAASELLRVVQGPA